MALGELARSIVGFVAIVLLGVVLRSTGLVRREDARPLNAVIVYIGLPAFVFVAVHGAKITRDAFVIVGVAWLVFAVCLVLAASASHWVARSRPERGAMLHAASLGNTGYLGYPLTAALLGPAALPLAVFYDVFGTVVQLVLVGFPLADRLGAHEVHKHRLGILGELATFPAFIAVVVALALSWWTVPVPVSEWLEMLASIVAPLIMLSVGISLRLGEMKRSVKQLAVVAGIRLVAAPLAAAVFGSLLLGGGPAYRASVLEAGMPTMMLTFAIGERFGLDTEFLAAAIFVTTALSVITVPVAQALLS